MLVHGHVRMLAALEVGQLFGVVAPDPACLVDRDGLPAAGGSVLMLQPVLDDFELQGAHRADDLASVEVGGEELGHTLVHQLIDALCQLLELQRVGVLDVAELLGREGGDAGEFQLLAFGEGIADGEIAGVVQTHDVTRVGVVDHRLLLGHEGRGRGELQLLSAPHVEIVPVALEGARTDLQEGDAVAVVGVHVGVDLEDEAAHLRLVGLYGAALGGGGARRRGDADEALQQLADAEIVDGRPEEDGSRFAAQVGVAVEGVVNPLNQLQIVAQLRGIAIADVLGQQGRLEVPDLHGRGVGRLALVGGEERQLLLVDVVDPLEGRAARNGERQRPHTDLELLLHLVQQVERILAGAVELVDEDDHRSVAHAAHLHQLAGLRLDALRAVDHDDDRIDGRQGAVGVLGEIFVSRGVEDVDLASPVFETHHGGGDRDASLPFDLHEVGGGSLLDLVALHGPGHVDGAAEEQQFLGQGGLAGIGVGDHRKGAAPRNLFL